MEQEMEQLRILVGDLFSKIESLEERLSILEDEKDALPKGPEPILTCIQCSAEYKESENGEGYCKYHNGNITYHYGKVMCSCCDKSASKFEDLLQYPGHAKGKHCSKHHTDYFYTNYYMFMSKLSNKAEQMWLEMDIQDHVTDSCQWAEVGVSDDESIFVLAGFSRNKPEVCASLKPQEVKKCKKSSVLVEKSDNAGGYLKAELLISGSMVEGITVAIKPSWAKTPYTKMVKLSIEGDSVKCGGTVCQSDPRPEEPPTEYTVPEGGKMGPMLEAGEDYSEGRKNDYPTVTNDDMFALEMKQLGGTEVNSNTWGMRDGVWPNLFTATIKIINGSVDIVSICDVLGEYQNTEGEWIACDDVYVGEKGAKDFMETKDFLIDGAAPMTIVTRLAIKIKDRPPNGNQECQRAHHSLPQPLLLRVTLVDVQKRTASLIFEQGNKPLPLATPEKRQNSWSKKKPLLFHLFADDVDLRKRSDVAIYYDDDYNVIYRPAPNDNGSTYYYVHDNVLDSLAYNAKKSGEKERELTGLRSVNKESKIEVFGVVDLDYQYTFALKVVITTATSSAVGYYLLPKRSIFSQATITATPLEVVVNSSLTVEWKLPRASKNDRIEIYKRFGNSYASVERNCAEEVEGSIKMKVPGSPGEYEVRYYPKCLQSSSNGTSHDLYVASAAFTVVPA